jgi:vancomycin permeability regulator SanA
MKNVVNRAFMAKKKQYIYPQTEVLPVMGTAVMLGASGDIHSGNTGQGDQTQNYAPRKVF